MKDEIENILGLDIPSTNKLILIYFKLNGDGCISQAELAKKLCCSVSGLNKSLVQLQDRKYLNVDSKTYKQSHYSVLI